ncbi:hypothetical protein PC110_g21606 [Phytophthora cactorum]|uniref:Pol protein n=1 Tax=Phytophthora cactorum TaxID=29920 RepID=A0A329RBZ7_9STRA|nr:hypothetical protein PC110_g21606 [Phytophthora cactorum]
MKTHPTFYVSRLKRYHGPQGPAAPQTPQASREEDPTPRNETQPQTSSNVQQRKAKTHATLVDREAAGTPEGSRAVEPQLGKPSTHHSPTADRTRKSASLSAVPDYEGHPGPVEAGGKPHLHRTRATRRPTQSWISEISRPNWCMRSSSFARTPQFPAWTAESPPVPRPRAISRDKNALTETINLRVLRLSHSRRRCTRPRGAPRRSCLVLEVKRGLLHLSSTVME